MFLSFFRLSFFVNWVMIKRIGHRSKLPEYLANVKMEPVVGYDPTGLTLTKRLLYPFKLHRLGYILTVFSCQFLVYNEFTVNKFSNKYPLEERTAKFGESIIDFCRSVKMDLISGPLINQLVRSGTSIGANYMEANAASSRKDFGNKIFICKKEAQETKHWLRMLTKCLPDRKEELRKLWSEVQELTLIFQKITSTLRSN